MSLSPYPLQFHKGNADAMRIEIHIQPVMLDGISSK